MDTFKYLRAHTVRNPNFRLALMTNLSGPVNNTYLQTKGNGQIVVSNGRYGTNFTALANFNDLVKRKMRNCNSNSYSKIWSERETNDDCDDQQFYQVTH